MPERKPSRLTQTQVVLAAKLGTIIAAVAILFYQDLVFLFNDALRNETTSYILAIPVFLVYLVYRKRKTLRVTSTLDTNRPQVIKHLAKAIGILLSTVAILLYWYGSFTFVPLEYHMAALPIFVTGLTIILFNVQTLRQAAFQIALLVLLVPPPSIVLYNLGATLSVVSAEASNAAANVLGVRSIISSEYGNPVIEVTRPNGEIIPFTMDIACSGIYSLIGFLVFVIFIVYIIRDKLWKRAALVPIGVLLIYLANITRITTILLIGYHYGAETALEVFHLLGGWVLVFISTLLLLITVPKLLKTRMFTANPVTKCTHGLKLSGNSQSFCRYCGGLLKYPQIKISKQDVAKIISILTIALLLATIQAPVLTLSRGLPEIAVQTPGGEQATAQILPTVGGYASPEFVYRDRDFEQLAKQDASLLYAYVPFNQTQEAIWIALEIASTRSALHKWETCLITWRQTHGYELWVTQLDLRDILILENPPTFARYFAFQYTTTQRIQVVLYWYETALFETNQTTQQRHAKISAIAYAGSFDEIPEIENQLAIIASAVASHWQPTKTWAPITLMISQNGDKLIVVAAGLLVFASLWYAFERRKERRTNAQAYQKLSKQNRQLIETVHRLEKEAVPTLEAIASKYNALANEKITEEEILQKLLEAEKIGILERRAVNQFDGPREAWKTEIDFKKTPETA